jgi:hypothetical protein
VNRGIPLDARALAVLLECDVEDVVACVEADMPYEEQDGAMVFDLMSVLAWMYQGREFGLSSEFLEGLLDAKPPNCLARDWITSFCIGSARTLALLARDGDCHLQSSIDSARDQLCTV